MAGAFAVSASSVLGWPLTFALVAAAFVLCVPLVLASPEPERPPVPVVTLREAVIEPFKTYFRREDAWRLALFLVLYKVGDNMAATMVNPFLKDLCFGNLELGASVKTIGVIATIAGGLLGSVLVSKVGLGRSLWILGVTQAAANLLYAVAASSRQAPLDVALCGSSPPIDLATHVWAYVAIAVEYGARSMAATAQGVLLLRVCDRKSAMTQFALLSSLFALGRYGAGLPSGGLVTLLGYPWFFVVCSTVMAVPGLVALQRISPFGDKDVRSAPAA